MIFTYYVEDMEATALVHATRTTETGEKYDVGARALLTERLAGLRPDGQGGAQRVGKVARTAQETEQLRQSWGLTPEQVAQQKRAERMFGGADDPPAEGGDGG